MTIYLALLGCLSLASIFELFHLKVKIKQKAFFYWFIVIALVLVAGLRYGLESDYWHYYYIFNGTIKVSSIEIGFKLFNKFVYFLVHDYGIYCIIVACLSMGLKGYFFEKLEYPFIVLLCYYLRFYVLFELNAIRQGLAMAFVIIGIYYLHNNNIKKYCIFVIIGMLFHTAAICGLLGIVLRKINFKLWHILVIYFGCIVFRLIFFDKVITSFSPYISYILGSNNNLIHGLQYIVNSGDKMQEMNYFSLLRVVIPGICLYFISDDKPEKMYYNLYFIGSILNLLFWGLDTIAFRIPAVFYIFEGYILNDALATKKLLGKKKKDLVFSICFMCVGFCDIWTFVAYLNNSLTLVPYKTILGR